MLGVIGAACHQYGMSLKLWSFVAPHGSLELPSIIIAGAAGFRLGHAMLFPGTLRWKESVARGGAEATRLISGDDSAAGHRRLPGRIFFAFASAGLAQIYRRRNAFLAAAAVAFQAGEGCAIDQSKSLIINLLR